MNKNFQMGMFFVLGLIILLVLFEVVSGVSLIKNDKKYLTYFESVGELRTGSDVRLSGVSVGKVEKVSLAGNRVEVELSISKDVILKKDSIASINMTSLLGSSYIGITFGSVNSKVLEEGGILESVTSPSFNSLLSKLDKTVELFNDQFAGYSDKINSILFNLDNVVASIANSRGSIGKLVNDPQLYDELMTSLSFFSSISQKIDSGEGTLGMLVNDEEIYNEASKTLKTLNYLTQKVATGEGSLGKFVNDDALYNSINDLSANLNQLVDKVNSGEGTLGKLVNDDRLYYDALNSVRKLKNAVETQEDLAPLTTITAAFGVMTLF